MLCVEYQYLYVSTNGKVHLYLQSKMLKYSCETLLFKLYVVLNYTSSQYNCE